jgi:hypothetical protein
MTADEIYQKKLDVIERLIRLDTAESLNYAFILLTNLELTTNFQTKAA